jgi:serine/threonine protein kinase
MSYLQGRGIIHRDLKSPNCFVNSHLEVCVGDFGTTKLASEARDGSASSQGPGGANNPRWLAPEVRLGGVATPASDVYSYGMTLYELLVWDVPWPKEKAWTIGNMLSNGARPPVPAREALPGPDTASFAQLPAFIKLMERCWADDQAARPPFADIMATLEKLMAEHESATGEGEQAGTSGAAAPAAAGLGPIKWRTPQPAARPPAPPQQSSHWDF